AVGKVRRIADGGGDADAPLLAINDLQAVVRDHVAAVDPLAQRDGVVDAGDRPHELQDVVVLGQVVRVAAGIEAPQRELLGGDPLRSQVPGQGDLVAVNGGQPHHAVDGRSGVTVGAVAVVVEDAAP